MAKARKTFDDIVKSEKVLEASLLIDRESTEKSKVSGLLNTSASNPEFDLFFASVKHKIQHMVASKLFLLDANGNTEEVLLEGGSDYNFDRVQRFRRHVPGNNIFELKYVFFPYNYKV